MFEHGFNAVVAADLTGAREQAEIDPHSKEFEWFQQHFLPLIYTPEFW